MLADILFGGAASYVAVKLRRIFGTWQQGTLFKLQGYCFRDKHSLQITNFVLTAQLISHTMI